MAEATSYTFFRIPKARDEATARQYRSLRLKALQTSPESFSSTFEIESAFTETHWISRLAQEGIETFICAASSPAADGSQAEEWVGQVTIRGPVPTSAYTLPEESGQPRAKSDDEEEKWQMLSLYNDPQHRGRGLAQSLVQEVLRYLQEDRPLPSILVRLMVKPSNTAVIHLYEKLGFELVGKCTLAEALVANGDAALVPKDSKDDPRYSTRSGLIMTRRFVHRPA